MKAVVLSLSLAGFLGSAARADEPGTTHQYSYTEPESVVVEPPADAGQTYYRRTVTTYFPAEPTYYYERTYVPTTTYYYESTYVPTTTYYVERTYVPGETSDIDILANSADRKRREHAAERLGKYGGPEALPYLRQAAGWDPDYGVRKDSAKAISRIERRYGTGY